MISKIFGKARSQMTVRQALKIINTYLDEKTIAPEDEELLIEAFDFIIEVRKDPDIMHMAGDYHRYRGNEKLAKIYYDMAREYFDYLN